MKLRLHDDLAEYTRFTDALYGADPVAHTVTQTALDQRLRGEVSPDDLRTLLTVHGDSEFDGAGPVGAAVRMHPWPLAVSALPVAAATPAVEALAEHDPELRTVFGPVATAEAFADAWCAAHGGSARIQLEQRLFRLDGLVAPTGVPGQVRRAGPGDVELFARWLAEFLADAVPADPVPDIEVSRRMLAAAGGVLFWQDGGEPVAMACASAPVRGMSRVTRVYTPPAGRGHGYASAVTAAASRWALDAGAREVALYTDLANPVSNRDLSPARLPAAARLRPVGLGADRIQLRIGPAPANAGGGLGDVGVSRR